MSSTTSAVRLIRTKHELDATIHTTVRKLVVVFFYNKFCTLCETMNTHFEQMAKTFPRAMFLKIDVDVNPEAMEPFGLTATPAFALLIDAKTVFTMSGPNEVRLREAIRRWI